MKKIIIFLISALLFTSCLEEYDLNLAEVTPRLVVEGLITNEKGPYYVRLTESHNGKPYDINYGGRTDNIKAVKDALIIITDNVNQVDTLIFLDNLEEYGYEYDLMFDRYYKPVYDDFGNIIDTILFTETKSLYGRGFYRTQTLEGIPGLTYSLKIIYQNEEYKAEAYMPPVPGIDSLGTIKIITPEGKADFYSPLLYFSEPQETKDYYLIQLVDETSARSSYRWDFYWPFSVLSDEFLQPYVNGLQINGGANLLDYEGSPIYSDGGIYVRLNSLTKEAYLYYKALIRQFDNDGGSFQPTPASAPTNISNGALGFFRASAVSEKSIVVNRWDGTQFKLFTLDVTEITATSAISGIDVNFWPWGIYPIGICWSTNPNPTPDDFIIITYYNEEPLPCIMTDLTPNTKYYVKAFGIDRYGMTHYGEQKEFTTLAE